MRTPIIERIVEQLEFLPDELQRRVLDFTHALVASTPRGVPSDQLLRFVDLIPASDLQLMHQAIEQGCEQVDWHAW